MRIHRLSLTGVGPFAATAEVDFDRFAASGRFLLTGPTGSGKTTLIDAIVFALYGDVAGGQDSSRDRIRSSLAGPEDPSRVELTFSTGAGTYRIERTPQYMRAKRRGTGTTPQNATVHLWRLSAPHGQAVDEPLTRLEEVGHEITRIVGLSREQFTQTIVLPQGKFAHFLRASSEERHELLRDVFGTGVYDRLQAELSARAKEARGLTQAARADLAAARRALADLLEAREAHAAPAAEDPPSPEGTGPADRSCTPSARLTRLTDQAPLDLEELSALLEEVQAASHAQVTELAERHGQAREARAAADRELQEARELAGRLQRRQALLEAQARLEADREADRARSSALDAAHRAARVTAVAQIEQRSRDHAAAAAGRAREVLARAEGVEAAAPDQHARNLVPEAAQALADLEQDAGPHGPRAADDPSPRPLQAQEVCQRLQSYARHLTDSAAADRQDAGALRAVVDLESGLAERQEDLDRQRQEATEAEAALEEDAGALESRPQRHAELQAALEAARQVAASLSERRLALQEASRRQEALDQATDLGAQADAVEQQVQAAAAAARQATQELAATRDAWVVATAGSLAAELVEGQPCPVCGSTSHPSPAHGQGRGVARADVQAAESACARADSALASLASQRAALSERRERALSEAGGPTVTAQELADALGAAQTDLEAAVAGQRRAQRLETELAGFAQETAQLREDLAVRRTGLAGTRERLKAQEGQLEEDRRRCHRARGHWESVARRCQDLLERAAWAGDLAARLEDVVEAHRARDQAQADLGAVLEREGFGSAGAAARAALGPQDLADLRAQVEQTAVEQARVAQGLADPQVAALSGGEDARVPQAVEALEAAEARAARALAELERARAGHSVLVGACSAVLEGATALDACGRDQAALLRVAELASGSNEVCAPLATWVLLERFNEVLTFANHRLSQMSGGRYELVQVDNEAGSARRRNRGLGLGVADHLVPGAPRDPKTLSGGETFYVSLALALALADVVTTESGGVAMETLFIDEGFGSLDPEALQAVLAELARLQAGGRTVGIVSHVEELRRQIPDRIEVRRTPAGSTLQVTG